MKRIKQIFLDMYNCNLELRTHETGNMHNAYKFLDTITTGNPVHGNSYYRTVLNGQVNYKWGVQTKEFEYARTYVHTVYVYLIFGM